MPTYEFRCPDGTIVERVFKMSEAPQAIPSPNGDGVAVRIISGGADLIFKGSGFYITDYGKDGKKDQRTKSEERAAKSDESSAAAKTESTASSASSSEKSAPGEKSEKAAPGAKSEKTAPSEKSEKSDKSDKSDKRDKGDKRDKKPDKAPPPSGAAA